MSNERKVTVTPSGVIFGKSFYSHERITGRNAVQLNGGEGIANSGEGVASRGYMEWLRGESGPSETQTADYVNVAIQAAALGVQNINTAMDTIDNLRTELANRDEELKIFAAELSLAICDNQVRSAMTKVGREKIMDLLRRYNKRLENDVAQRQFAEVLIKQSEKKHPEIHVFGQVEYVSLSDYKSDLTEKSLGLDLIHIRWLNALAGYIENGTSVTVKFYQDDATGSWNIEAGCYQDNDPSLTTLIKRTYENIRQF